MNRSTLALGAAAFIAGGLYMLARRAFPASLGSVADDVVGSDDAVIESSPFTDEALGALYGARSVLTGGSGGRMSPDGLVALELRETAGGVPNLTVYLDIAGIQTIGFGHRVKPGEDFAGGITPDRAAQILADDVRTAENAVNALVSVSLSQNQFDALVSFAFNAGAEAFRTSTLLRLLNSGDVAGAAAQFARWNKVHQGNALVVSDGLTNRRASEAQQFLA